MVEQASGEYCEAVSDERSESRIEPAEIDSVTGDSTPDLRDASDLDAIESDLAAVESALNRLDSGTYWTDEVTGEPIPDHVLEENPLVRRAPR